MTGFHEIWDLSRTLCSTGMAATALCALMASAGCQGEQATVPLPTPSTPHAGAYAEEGTSDTEAARKAYLQFVATLDRAASIPAAKRRQELSRYMVDPQLSKVLEAIQAHEAKNVSTYGSSIPHIKSVHVFAGEATVHDCQDGTRSGLIDKSSNKKLNRGVQETNTRSTLKKGADGTWRVSKYHILGEGC